LHGVLERLNVVGPELALGLFVRYVLTRVGGVDLAESNLLPGLDDELLPVVHEGGLPVAGVPIRRRPRRTSTRQADEGRRTRSMPPASGSRGASSPSDSRSAGDRARAWR